MKLKVFVTNKPEEMEKKVNDWLSENDVEIEFTNQSESSRSHENPGSITMSIWYED